MTELLDSLAPVLSLIGWVGLIGAAFLFVLVAVERRQHAGWQRARYETAVLEGQPCLMWTGRDGVLNCQQLGSVQQPAGEPIVYYKPGDRENWQLHEPQSHVRLFRILAWSMATFGLTCQVLRQVAAAL